MSLMRIGDLNKRIAIEYPERTDDGGGSSLTEWKTFVSVWAAIWPVSATEMIRNNQPSGEITHRIRIRYRPNITAGYRIRYGSRYFNITGPPISPNEVHEYLDMVCKEAV